MAEKRCYTVAELQEIDICSYAFSHTIFVGKLSTRIVWILIAGFVNR